MQTKRAAALAAGLVLFLGAAGIVFSQRPVAQAPLQRGAGLPLIKRLAVRSKLPEKTVQDLLDALGPVVLEGIQRGGVEVLPRLGKVRVVRIPEHKDMERGTGRVFTVPGKNYVVFDPEDQLSTAANFAQVVPNEIVPQFQYNLIPGQTPSLKTDSTKVRSIRTP